MVYILGISCLLLPWAIVTIDYIVGRIKHRKEELYHGHDTYDYHKD